MTKKAQTMLPSLSGLRTLIDLEPMDDYRIFRCSSMMRLHHINSRLIELSALAAEGKRVRSDDLRQLHEQLVEVFRTVDVASLFLAVYGEPLDHKKRSLKLRDYAAACITHHPPFNRKRLPPPRLPERGL